MHPTLLQADPLTAAAQLTNYGPLGIIVFLFICVIVYLEKIRREAEAKTAKRIQDQDDKISRLEERIDKIQTEDRAKMLDVIQHNTDIMEEVVAHFQKAKRTN